MQIQKLKTVDADTLLSTPIRKTLFVVDGLIPQGLSVLSGPSKIGSGLEQQIEQFLMDYPTTRLVIVDTFPRRRPWWTGLLCRRPTTSEAGGIESQKRAENRT